MCASTGLRGRILHPAFDTAISPLGMWMGAGGAEMAVKGRLFSSRYSWI